MFGGVVGGTVDCVICCCRFSEDSSFYWEGCGIINRSRKLVLLLCSKVGVNCGEQSPLFQLAIHYSLT